MNACGNASKTMFRQQVVFLNHQDIINLRQSLLTGKRDRSESVSRDRENLYRILEKKAEHAIRGENEILKKLFKIEADVEIRKLGAEKFRNCLT